MKSRAPKSSGHFGINFPGWSAIRSSIRRKGSKSKDQVPEALETRVLLTVIPVTHTTSPTDTDNDFTRLQDAMDAAVSGDVISINSDLNFAELNAAFSYSSSFDVDGSSNIRGIRLKDGVNNLTITSPISGGATITGLGDRAGKFDSFVFSGSTSAVGNNNLTISNLNINDFESAIMLGWNGSGTYNATNVHDNDIILAGDDDAKFEFRNIAVYFGPGTSQQLVNNTVTFQADGKETTSHHPTSIGFQDYDAGVNGTGVNYNGLTITGNTFQIAAGAPAYDSGINKTTESVTAIWDRGQNNNSSAITISGNSFLGTSTRLLDNALRLSFQSSTHPVTGNTFDYVDNVLNQDSLINPSAGDQYTFESNTLTHVGGTDGIFLQNVGGVVHTTVNWNISNTINTNSGIRGLNELSNQAAGRPNGAATDLNSVNGIGAFTTAYVDDNWATSARFADPDGIDTGRGPIVNGFNAFNTIGAGIAAVPVGGTVDVGAGNYNENLVINKRLTLTGTGSGNTAADTIIHSVAPNTPVITITGTGVDNTNRLVVNGVRVTGATGAENPGAGILVQGSDPAGHFTFSNVAAVGNQGAGIAFNNTGSVTDAVISHGVLSNNGFGLRIATAVPSFDGLTVSDSQMDNNASSAFTYNPSGSQTNVGTNFNFTNDTFTNNSTAGVTNQHDLSFFGFRGAATLTNVTVTSGNGTAANSSSYGILFTNGSGYTPAGNIALNGVTVNGFVGKGALSFQLYSDVSHISLTDVDVKGVSAPWGQLILDSSDANPLNLGNTKLATMAVWGSGGANALNASFYDVTSGNLLNKAVLADNFTIENQVGHKVDNNAVGLVRWNAGNVYVTTPGGGSTDSSIQNGVGAASEGDTVNVQAGIYTEQVTINKSVTIDGEGSNAASPAVTLQTPTGNAITLTSTNGTDDVTIQDIAFNGQSTANAGVFIKHGVGSQIDTLTIDRSTFTEFKTYAIGTDGDVANAISISNAKFVNNGYNTGGSGAVSLFDYDGDASFTTVDVTNNGARTAQFGIQVNGIGTAGANDLHAMGALSFSGVTVSGLYKTQMIGIQDYSTATSLSLTNVVLGGSTSKITGTFGSSLRFDAVGAGTVAGSHSTVDLGNTYFKGLASDSAQKTELEFAPDNQISFLVANATQTHWDVGAATNVVATALDLSQAFAVSDRILDYIDTDNQGRVIKGYANLQDGKAFVTTGNGGGNISRAVQMVATNGTVNVAAGTYAQQVTIDRSVKVVGAGAGATIVQAPATMVVDADNSRNIVTVTGSTTNAEISGLTVAGPGPGGAGFIDAGISILGEATANIHNNTITAIRDGSLSGAQHGYGIKIGGSTAGHATIANNTISDYQKTGIRVVNTGATAASITGNTVTGVGDTAVIAQNGIVVLDGALATITGNTVSGNMYSGPSSGANPLTAVQSVGILLLGAASGTTVSSNLVNANDIGIYNLGSGTSISGNTLGGTTANRYEGILVDQGTTTLTNNTITGGNYGVAIISFDDPSTNGDTNATLVQNHILGSTIAGIFVKDGDPTDGYLTKATIGGDTVADTNTVDSNNATGILVEGAEASATVKNNTTLGGNLVGIDVNGGSATITGNTISGDGTGIVVHAGSATINASNSITGNTTAGITVAGGTATISANAISSNTGSGVNVSGGSASISGNTIGSNGTGIAVSGGSATIDGANGISSNTTGIAVTGGTAGISGGNTITGGSIGVDVAGGTATIGANTITGATTGVRFTTTGAGSVTGVNFDSATDNGTDLLLTSTAGAVTLGAGNAFAGDTFFIDDQSTQSFNLVSIAHTFDIGNSDNFAIEDKIHHRVDTNLAVTVGLVTWVAGNIFVTTPGVSSTDSSIQRGADAASAGNTVNVQAGTYNEDVTVGTAIKVSGAGNATTTVSGLIGGSGSTFALAAAGVELSGFTITRDGNNTTDWNNAGLNTAGVSVQGQGNYALVHDNVITGMRTGIDINNSNGNTIRNNVINDNRTGLIFRNQTDNTTVVENAITNNWTAGIVFLDAGGGPQSALNSTFSNNNISGNWYGQIVDRQTTAGSNLKDFSGNWFGTALPTTTSANSTEPGYVAQIPVEFGGSAVAPGGQPDIAGPGSANFDISPLLTTATDTDVETHAGWGTFGFQGNLAAVNVTSALGQVGTTGRIQEGIDRVNAGGTVNVLPGNYTERAVGRTLSTGGTYQFGLFVSDAKSNTTIRGVDASGNAITSANAVLAHITTDATNGFGPSGVFIEGDHVTLQGLDIGSNLNGQNKTVEVTGDAFKFQYNKLSDPYGDIYLDDMRFNDSTNTSHLQSYTIDSNFFGLGATIDIASGAGYSGAVSGRTITGNTFTGGTDAADGVYWPTISFNGSNTGVPWFVQSVGGAVITGNTFLASDQYIRARGDYDNSQFNWESYFENNTFATSAVDLSDLASFSVRPSTQVSGGTTFTNVRRIGGQIQPEIDNASAGDTVLVGAGTYNLTASISIDKQISLLGAEHGVDARTRTAVPETILNASALASFPVSSISVGSTVNGAVIDGFTLQNSSSANGSVTVGAVYMAAGSNSTTVRNNIIKNSHTGIFVENNSAVNATVIEKNLFIDNNANGTPTSTGIYADNYSTGGSLQNVVIQDNKFTNTNAVDAAWAIQMANFGASAFANITVSNNDISKFGRGMYFYNTTGGAVTGNTIDGATHYAIGLFGANGVAANSSFTISGNTITNSNIGLEVASDTTGAAYSGALTVSGNTFGSSTTTYIDNESATSINAANNTFGGVASSSATNAQQFAISDKITDGVDVSGLGLVRTNASHVYVTQNSFNTGLGTTAASIQRGIDVAAASGDTVQIQGGSYTGNVSTSGKSVTIGLGAAIAQVTVNGNFTLDSNDTLAVDINETLAGASPVAGTDYDQLTVNGGTVTLNGATLGIPATFPKKDYLLINNTAVVAVGGTFNGFPNNTTQIVNGQRLSVNYTGGDNNDVVLSNQSALDPALVGTSGDDNFVLDFQSNGEVIVTLNSTVIGTISSGATPISIEGVSGFDSVTINTTSANDVFGLASGAVTVNGRTINVTQSGSATINGTINALAGNDTFNVTGAAGLWSLNAGDNDDSIIFGNGASVIGVVTGGNGIDKLDYSAYTTGVSASLTSGSVTGASFATTFENLVGGSGNDTLTGNAGTNVITGNLGNDTLSGGGGSSDTLVESGDVSFTLTNTTLSGLGSDTLSGFANVILTGGDSANVFTVSGFTGTATLNGGGGSDTIAATKDSDYTLTNSSLTAGTMNLTLTSFEVANLTGGVSANTFTVSGWTGTGTLNGASNPVGSNDTVVSSNDADFTLSSTSLIVTGGANFTLALMEAANLTGGASANTFTVSGWTGKGVITGGVGAGVDTIVATKDRNFGLALGSLTASDAMDLTLSGIGNAVLTGGANLNMFTVTNWAGVASIDGLGNNDTLAVTRNADFTLTDSSLTTSDGLNLSLANIEIAKLTGGSNANSFDLSGWNSAVQGAIVGGGGVDTVTVSRDANITLTNSLLTVKATVGGAVITNMTLSAVGNANLSGGAGTVDNTYTLTGWTGGGSVDGKLGNDTIVKSDDVNFTLTDGSLVTATSVAVPAPINTMTLANLEAATLTGGASNNVFDVSGWTKTVALNAGAGTGDKLLVTKNADITLGASTIAATDGLTGTVAAFELVVLTGGSGDNRIDASLYAGAADLNGMDGNDILIGGAGVNNIFGGNGLDLLIGGLGADVLQGQGGGDILIGARTGYANNFANLDQILAKWTSGASYASRVADIKNGNGTPPLNAANITDDSVVDTLTGGSDAADANLDFLFEKIGTFADAVDSDAGETPVTF